MLELEERMLNRGYVKGVLEPVELREEGNEIHIVEKMYADIFNGVHDIFIEIYLSDLQEEIDFINKKYRE